MNLDPRTRDAAISAVERVLFEEHGSAAGADQVVRAVLDLIPDAIVEQPTLYVLTLEAVDRETATYTAAGGMTLILHRGDWMERGRPAKLWVTAQHFLEPYAAV